MCAGFVAPADEIGGKYCEDCHVTIRLFTAAVDDGVEEGVRAYALARSQRGGGALEEKR